MDRTKKARDVERNLVTRLVTTLEADLSKKPVPVDEIITSLTLLETRKRTLAELDDQMQQQILDSDQTADDLEVEARESEDFMRKATFVKVKADRILNIGAEHHLSSGSQHGGSSSGYRNRMKYPKIGWKFFDGEDKKQWISWWASFKKVDEDDELDGHTKFEYLLQALKPGSKADGVARHYVQSNENYPKAIADLQERFGQKRVLEDLFMRELARLLFAPKAKMTLANFYDELQATLNSLESLEVSTAEMTRFLFPMIESSLNEEILIAWQRSANFRRDGSTETPPSPKTELDYLMTFLKAEIDNEEQRKLARIGTTPAAERRRGRQGSYEDDVPTAAGLFGGVTPKPNRERKCVFCGKGHDSENCQKAQKMSHAEKIKLAKKGGACYKCLKKNHFSNKCWGTMTCVVCQQKHVTLMCDQVEHKRKAEASEETVLSSLNCTADVILQTLMVRLVNPGSGRSKLVRVLLDNGSQRSYLLKRTVKDLKLDTSDSVIMNHSLFGGTSVVGQAHALYNVLMNSVFGDVSVQATLMDQNQICNAIPRMCSGPWVKELKESGFGVSDLDPKNSSEIEVLLGADVIGKILTGKLRQLDNGLTAIETKFGWTLMGETGREGSMTLAAISMTITSASVAQLWDLDILGIRDPIERKSQEQKEKEALDHFQQTVVQEGDGRYTVHLPWTRDTRSLPSNRAVALKRLETTTRKLQALGQFSVYDQIFQDWESEGIISTVMEDESESVSSHYLPHRAVFKVSATTPIRPVFDASSKSGRNPSLNDCLEKGPNLLEVIPSILLRFRMGPIGVTADVRKAFLMINVAVRDRDFLKFLWWEDISKKVIKVYRHNCVVFGMTASPFLLIVVILHHLNQYRDEYPEVVALLERSLYVDNLVMPVGSDIEFQRVKELSTNLMSKAGMELRQWERSGEHGVTNVLGLKWDKGEDCLFCETIPIDIPLQVTKRTILSHLQRVYDPLGLWSPVLIVPKIWLQQAWSENRKWDEEVSEEMKIQFMLWSKELSEVMVKVRLPRNCSHVEDGGSYQLHVFGDASKKAYAAVAFLRVEDKDGVKIYFMQSKSRVAPLKEATIPRKELLSCTIAARLANSVKTAMNLECPTYFWSDSSTALSWIRRSTEWGTFVGNRVKEILGLTQVSEWRHVPGIYNPADLPSRGISPSKYLESKWWEGPDWLKRDSGHWPNSEPEVDEGEIDRERKRSISTLTVMSSNSDWLIRRNNHHFNLCVWSFVFRFLDGAKKLRIQKCRRPTVKELKMTEIKLIKIVQRQSFPVDRSVIEGLRVELDCEGVIRVKTKVIHRLDTDTFRRPILLPQAHPFVDLIISQVHQQNTHGGPQLLMSRLRERFWIVQGRRTISKALKKCVSCRRFSGKKAQVIASALPEPRVRDATAFEVTGVDLTGHLMLKTKVKVYIVIFTCAVYRCVHLELVDTVSTNDFLMAFTRFSKRKQRPSIVYTDNGTNFVGAVNLFEMIDWEKVKEKTEQYKIKWNFNLPAAPFWGGFWERLIRSVKDLLRRMLGSGKLTRVQLETALCEVEASMNNRPLTYVTEDQDDFIPITPAMFIHQLPNTDVPEADLVRVPNLGAKVKALGHLMIEIRKRFRLEYLGQLVQRGKDCTSTTKLAVGDVVLVEIDGQKRVLWPMARIEELIPGKDGETRVARVRTKTGRFLRPIQRLVPLEISEAEFPGISKSRDTTQALEPVVISMEKPKQVQDPEPIQTRSGRVVKRIVRFEDEFQ